MARHMKLRCVDETYSPLTNVDDTGIEPVTPTMSMWCSTAEPIVLGTSFMKSITSPTAAHFRVTPVEVGTGFEPV